MNELRDYREVLRNELASRCGRNPKYSLRSFARDVGLSPSRLSHVLKGDFGLSREAALAVSRRLGWSANECESFADLVDAQHARGKLKRELAQKKLEARKESYQDLSAEFYRVIADWYHFAILELTKTAQFKSDSASSRPERVARALGISVHEAAAAIERLKRLKLLTQKKDGALAAIGDFSANPAGIPSEAIRKSHKQILAKAIDAVDFQGVEERDLSSMILALDEKDLGEAKRMLKEFRRSFDRRFSAPRRQTNRVYCLGMQFFRLQERD
ncbi:MAG: DUF4423 domain-containing protein [Oligoflexia bacterium]|nr:DUF4423 domain-containing protein [Oligoflexia bacterium]